MRAAYRVRGSLEEQRFGHKRRSPPWTSRQKGGFSVGSGVVGPDAGVAHDSIAPTLVHNRLVASVVGHVVAALATRDEWRGAGFAVHCTTAYGSLLSALRMVFHFVRGLLCVHTSTLLPRQGVVKSGT